MKTVTFVATLAVLGAPFAALPTPVLAATAHNSQAGGMGDTSNNAAPAGMTKRMKQMSGARKTHRKRM